MKRKLETCGVCSNNKKPCTSKNSIDVNNFFEHIDTSVNHTVMHHLLSCQFCGFQLDQAIDYNDMYNIWFSNVKCANCKHRFSAKESYYELSHYFQELADHYQEKADDENAMNDDDNGDEDGNDEEEEEEEDEEDGKDEEEDDKEDNDFGFMIENLPDGAMKLTIDKETSVAVRSEIGEVGKTPPSTNGSHVVSLLRNIIQNLIQPSRASNQQTTQVKNQQMMLRTAIKELAKEQNDGEEKEATDWQNIRQRVQKTNNCVSGWLAEKTKIPTHKN